ncbi:MULTISPECIES: YbaB/EbfC family nucleoid-associated protein [Actinosynnema]|uniref:YbaB/EbfC family nucleoid-associated protein n=1 Tax=Actinosynnema TaxID=40566 RepID=UPI0020A3D400|nr:YbaB/EbfC family nucleoid-associated protein [Actinosynnema pretiosum]MCP2094295.1 YbaB/EbfC DNA-binding family protein [Actinosynnema pretiosum]
MPEDIGGSERMVADWETGLKQKAQRYEAMAERVQGMSVTETSRDGHVRLTIGSNGILTDLQIAEPARERRMAEVSAEIMRTLQKAQSRIPELLQQAMAETIGTQDQTANTLFQEAKKNFPAPPAEERPQAPVHREMSFGIEDERAAPPTPPRHAQQPPVPPQPPQRRPRRDTEEDDDFGGQSFLR